MGVAPEDAQAEALVAIELLVELIADPHHLLHDPERLHLPSELERFIARGDTRLSPAVATHLRKIAASMDARMRAAQRLASIRKRTRPHRDR